MIGHVNTTLLGPLSDGEGADFVKLDFRRIEDAILIFSPGRLSVIQYSLQSAVLATESTGYDEGRTVHCPLPCCNVRQHSNVGAPGGTLGRSPIQLAIPNINAGSHMICTKSDK